jgi:hypothetical protein
VYLSPDATDVLMELAPDKVYCIGGLVDRSVSRYASLSHAKEHGVPAAVRLPLREYCPMVRRDALLRRGSLLGLVWLADSWLLPQHNNALNIDTVVKILLKFRECGSWPTALTAVVPQRRRVKQEHLPATQPQAAASDQLWVGGLPLADPSCIAAVQAACAELGSVSASFDVARNYGFVRFKDSTQAAQAKTKLHRQEIGGAMLRVQWSKSPSA